MSVFDKLQQVIDTKNAIKNAIIQKGVPVSSVDSFASYPIKIGTILNGPLGSGKVDYVLDDLIFHLQQDIGVNVINIDSKNQLSEITYPFTVELRAKIPSTGNTNSKARFFQFSQPNYIRNALGFNKVDDIYYAEINCFNENSQWPISVLYDNAVPLPADEFFTATVIYTSTRLYLYINAECVVSYSYNDTASPSFTNSSLYIKNGSTSNRNMPEVDLVNFRIYNRQLSETEIYYNYLRDCVNTSIDTSINVDKYIKSGCVLDLNPSNPIQSETVNPINNLIMDNLNIPLSLDDGMTFEWYGNISSILNNDTSPNDVYGRIFTFRTSESLSSPGIEFGTEKIDNDTYHLHIGLYNVWCSENDSSWANYFNDTFIGYYDRECVYTLTIDSNKLSLYYNGSLILSSTNYPSDMIASNSNSEELILKYLTLFTNTNISGENYHGGIGYCNHLKVYNRVLQDFEIKYNVDVASGSANSSKIIIYGFCINQDEADPDDRVVYLKDAVGMTPASMGSTSFNYGSWQDVFFMSKPCMLKYDGTVDYYLDPNDYSKKIDGTPSDINDPDYNGNVMVEWPLIWYKFEYSSGNRNCYFYVSNKKVDDTYHCYCNYDSDNNIIEHFYNAAYNGTGTERLRSLSGVQLTPANGNGNTAGAVEVERAVANNTTDKIEWYTDVLSDYQLITMLLVLISKSTDIQAKFGRGLDTGVQSTKEAYVTGALNNKGLFWGDTVNGTSAVKVFGIENFYGCVWHRVAGMVGTTNYKYKVKLTHGTIDGSTAEGFNSDGTGYIDLNINQPSDIGYIKYCTFTDYGFVPTDTTGSSTTFYADYDYNYRGTGYLMMGGRVGADVSSGPFYVSLGNDFGVSSWHISAFLSCKPLARRG